MRPCSRRCPSYERGGCPEARCQRPAWGLAIVLFLLFLFSAGCSMYGVYDGACCAFQPHPTSYPSPILTLYGPGGRIIGTAVGGSVYTNSGAYLGGVRGY